MATHNFYVWVPFSKILSRFISYPWSGSEEEYAITLLGASLKEKLAQVRSPAQMREFDPFQNPAGKIYTHSINESRMIFLDRLPINWIAE